MRSNKKNNPYFIFGLLISIFIGPLIVAVVLYSTHPYWLTQKTLNKGQFISPSLDFFTLNKQVIFKPIRHNPWQVFYLSKTDCNQLCQNRLQLLKHAILALGKNRNQVSASLIQLTQFSKIKNIDISYYSITTDEYRRFFASKGMYEGYYLVDPHGKIILYYPANASNENLYKDLTHLL